MPYTFELIDRDREPALIVRRRTPVGELPSVLGPAWSSIMMRAEQAGAQAAGPPFVAYHNMDMSDLDVEIGFAVTTPVEGEGDVLQSEIPAGRAVTTVHVGPYDRVGLAYEALRAWMRDNDLQPAGPPYEFYLNDPYEVQSDELLTRLVWAVA